MVLFQCLGDALRQYKSIHTYRHDMGALVLTGHLKMGRETQNSIDLDQAHTIYLHQSLVSVSTQVFRWWLKAILSLIVVYFLVVLSAKDNQYFCVVWLCGPVMENSLSVYFCTCIRVSITSRNSPNKIQQGFGNKWMFCCLGINKLSRKQAVSKTSWLWSCNKWALYLYLATQVQPLANLSRALLTKMNRFGHLIRKHCNDSLPKTHLTSHPVCFSCISVSVLHRHLQIWHACP